MASDDIKPLLSDRDIDDIILTGSHRNAAGGIYATSVYAFAKEVAIAAIQADREIRAGHVALLKGSMAQAERENDELRAALAQAQSSGQAAPSDAEIIADMEARGWKHLDDEERADIIQFARALLSRYGQAPAASAEPVAWLDPDTADVIHQQRKYDWERFFGEGGKRKAETYTVPLGRIAAPVAAQAPQDERAAVAVRPGSILSFDGGSLRAERDGGVVFVVDEDDFTLEDDRSEGPDGRQGSVHWIARIPASEIAALRDFLGGHVRPTDDAMWDQTIRERDEYHDMADELATAIAQHLNVDVGEHSSANSPWVQALEAIKSAPALEEEDRPIHTCGALLTRNPHPHAGKPRHTLTAGYMYECIPCLVKARHGWASRAMKVEAELRDAKAKLRAQAPAVPEGQPPAAAFEIRFGNTMPASVELTPFPRRAEEARADGWEVHELVRRSAAAPQAPTPPASAAPTRQQLRALVDLVWNEVTESAEVPDTPWADRLIDKVFAAPSPQGDAPAYRLLDRSDIIQRGDEFLDDDCVNWNGIAGWEAGMLYNPVLLKAGRRQIDADSSTPATEKGES